MAKKVVNFMCTAFRDGFQSVFGMRVLPKDYLPVVEAAKDAGIRYFEAGGGAAFQSAFFYCNENAFDVMDRFRLAAGPDANLQTLARGRTGFDVHRFNQTARQAVQKARHDHHSQL